VFDVVKPLLQVYHQGFQPVSRGVGHCPPAESIDEDLTTGFKISAPITEGICSWKNSLSQETFQHYILLFPVTRVPRQLWWHGGIQNDLLMTGKFAPLNISQSKFEVIEAGSLPSALLARPGK